ncbi:GMC family oxidoreductase [Hyphomicrobium sp.]|uniref:GMC family oxidoreductase n=1 Tax=Hyphomicrobium sp. TaxID=82 RepID=UPI0025BE1449|nr:GMC family oxidoreductase [Hyphomicrobium sp.]MCC7250776.1 GMC family oxidoreductase [Hyphomicrobium sp.]
MIEDARHLSEGSALQCDVCIVGAGAAGLTLASEFAGSPYKVLLLESGGLEYDSTVQQLYKGANVGLLYEPLDLCRVRTFGGSTDPRGWGGWCKPLADIDFEQRDWVPLSGWPIGKRDLAPYYRRAFATLSLNPDTERLADEDSRKDVLPTAGVYCHNEPCPLSPAPHLGYVKREQLRAASNVRVLVHANVTEIETDDLARQVTGLKVATLNGTRFSVSAPYVLLAAGGVENARVLLLSDTVQKNGLGNDSGFVGSCFMEHPRYAWGRLSGEHLAPIIRRYDPGTPVGQRRANADNPDALPLFGASLALTEKAQREHHLLGARSWLVPVSASGEREAGREIKELVFWLKKRRIPSDTSRRILGVLGDLPNAAGAVSAHLLAKLRPARQWQFITVLEQDPDRTSRVSLDTARDALGLRRIKIDWRVSPLVKHTFRKTRELFAGDLRAAGIDVSTADELNQSEDAPRWVWHHMGTTRMSADPAQGVVDADCRVHGMTNLYVAGSSVFPTVGNDMPTITIVALAHRLADHIKLKLSKTTTSDAKRLRTDGAPPGARIAVPDAYARNETNYAD